VCGGGIFPSRPVIFENFVKVFRVFRGRCVNRNLRGGGNATLFRWDTL
jgi:hypothetical protein